MIDTKATGPGLIVLHAEAVHASLAVLRRIDHRDLRRPSPCAGWTVEDLLAHMTIQNNGFAAAARGARWDLQQWQPQPPGPDPIASYSDSAEDIVAAFAEPGVIERGFWIPEFSTVRTIPGADTVRAQLIDSVVHTWDLARPFGIEPEFSPALVQVAHEIAAGIPDGPERLAPSAFFRPARPAAPDTSGIARIVALLGRDPGWQI